MTTKHPHPPKCDHECKCKQETLDYRAMYQRVLADGENMRKRLEEEKRVYNQFALQGFLSDLLPVLDNFQRAVEHVPEEQQSSPWVTGLMYIQKQLQDLLLAQGIQEITAEVGSSFNPDEQEAVGVIESEEMPEDHIVQVTNRGYRLHERVLRPVQVMVAKHLTK